MAVLAATYFQSSLVYLAIALPLCLWFGSQSHLPVLSGIVGSTIAVVLFCSLAFAMPSEFGDHVKLFIVDPFYYGGWRWSSANAIQSVMLHIGVPTVLCVTFSSGWSDPR